MVNDVSPFKLNNIFLFRYRVYLENEDDEIHSEMETDNVSSAEMLDDVSDDEKENHRLSSRRKSIPNSDLVNGSDFQVKYKILNI